MTRMITLPLFRSFPPASHHQNPLDLNSSTLPRPPGASVLSRAREVFGGLRLEEANFAVLRMETISERGGYAGWAFTTTSKDATRLEAIATRLEAIATIGTRSYWDGYGGGPRTGRVSLHEIQTPILTAQETGTTLHS